MADITHQPLVDEQEKQTKKCPYVMKMETCDLEQKCQCHHYTQLQIVLYLTKKAVMLFSGKRCLMTQEQWFNEEEDIDLKAVGEKLK